MNLKALVVGKWGEYNHEKIVVFFFLKEKARRGLNCEGLLFTSAALKERWAVKFRAVLRMSVHSTNNLCVVTIVKVQVAKLDVTACCI